MKKVLIIVGALIFLTLSSAGIFYLSHKSNPKPSGTQSIKIVPTSAPRSTWDDQSGFTFTYDPALVINKHDEDQDNYAHVEMTNPAHPGRIIVWAKDTTAADATAWVRTEPEYKGASVIDTTFAGKPGQKIVITTPNKKIVTGTIYDGLLFYAEQSGDDPYWQTEYNSMTESFTFKPVDNGTSGNNSAAGDQTSEDDSGSVDEEETIQ
jgi:hypothetical protein